MTRRYFLHKIYILLTEHFAAEELLIFCNDHPDFAIRVPAPEEANKVQLIDDLVEAARLNSGLEVLLAWAEKRHPAAYQAYLPYSFAVDEDDDGQALNKVDKGPIPAGAILPEQEGAGQRAVAQAKEWVLMTQWILASAVTWVMAVSLGEAADFAGAWIGGFAGALLWPGWWWG